jgi:hypothetical protein
MKIVFQDPSFSLELLRTISEKYHKGADIDECQCTSYRIKEVKAGILSGSGRQKEFTNMLMRVSP